TAGLLVLEFHLVTLDHNDACLTWRSSGRFHFQCDRCPFLATDQIDHLVDLHEHDVRHPLRFTAVERIDGNHPVIELQLAFLVRRTAYHDPLDDRRPVFLRLQQGTDTNEFVFHAVLETVHFPETHVVRVRIVRT